MHHSLYLNFASKLRALIDENAHSALLAQHTTEIDAEWQVEDVSRALQDLASYAPMRWVLLAGNEDAATLIAVLRQLLDSLTLNQPKRGS